VDVADLLNRRGRVRYLFFWGHQPSADGRITASCLSQWWPSPFTVDDVTFPTAEHYMMYSKARLFGDLSMADRVLGVRHPNEAKTLGRQVSGFDEERWAAARYDIVVAGSVAKFGQNDDLRAFLLGTGDRVLVEASPLDRVWGIGLAADDERADKPDQWKGLNLLGFALMDARDILRKDAE
jgi:ribA/ribD-fused uncharacterized protein